MSLLPLFLNLEHKNVIVIGGGSMATRRILQIMESSPFLTVISPSASDTIQQLHAEERVVWLQRTYERADLLSASLIILAAGDAAVHRAVHKEAPAACFINDVMEAEKGTAVFPAHLQRGRLQIALTTGGASPKLSRKITQEIAQAFPEDYGQYIEFLYEARQLLKQLTLPQDEKHAYLEAWLTPEYQKKEKQLETLKKLHGKRLGP